MSEQVTSGVRGHTREPASAAPERSAPGDPRAYHETIPGYSVTPLVELPDLASRIGVSSVVVKDEQARLGLPSFKVLGGSWAVHRLVASLSREPVLGRTFDDLVRWAERLGPQTLVTATDGNHGRGVARMARLLGWEAEVLVPDDMVGARIAAIESEGARVEVVDGDYDVAVAAASARGQQDGWHTVADVATREDDDVPRWVMDGYATIFDEVLEQAERPPTALFVQAGVGALAGAAARYFERHAPELRVGLVEPLTAACVLDSLIAGEPVSLDQSQGSMMAGLNCGTPSTVAWPVLQRRVAAAVALDDDACGDAMRELADAGIVAGESGAAGLAGLVVAVGDPTVRAAMQLDEHARVLLLNTEGATDPANYRRVTGRAPADVTGDQGS